MDHSHTIMSSLRISLKFVFLGSVILQWYQAHGDNAESEIWKSLDNNLESTNEYDLGFTDEEMEGNFKDQVVDNAIEEIDNYHYNEMAYGDIVKDKTLLKRGIEKLQDKNKRRKLKHKIHNLGEEKSNSLMDTIIENPNVVQGHLKDLISRYSEAHKKMHDKININGFKSLAGDAKIINNNSESIDTNKVSTKHNTHRANKDAVIKDEFWNMKTNGSYLVSSMLKNNAEDSNNVTLQSISPNEIKNKTNSLSVSNDGESKSKIEKRKKNHKVKDIFENKLEAYAGVESGGKTQSNEEIRRNYVNRLIQINPIGEYNNSKNEHENYANISSINNGFLTAVEKKYFSMNNGALTKFKPKTSIDFGLNVNKPENSDSQKNNYRILDRNEIGDIDRIQPSHSSNSKNLSREQFYDVNHKLEKDENEIKENKVIKENNTLTERIHVAQSKNNRNLDGHHFHNNKERYKMEDSKQTKTHTFDEKLTLKEGNKDSKHHKKPANLLLRNYESQHINAKNGEKRINKNRLHRKASVLKSNKQLDFLDSGIDIPNIEREETMSKLKSLGNTKDKSKRRNERGIEDVEHKNSKLWKYRMGVDSRGRSRLMISGDKNNNSGSLNEGDESNNKAGNKRSIFRPNNQKQSHISQFNEIPLEEEENINDMKDNDVDDSFDDNADNANNEDTEEYADVKKVFARRAHHPKYNDDELRVTDCCVEYKGEKVSGKITRTTTVPIPTTTEKMDSQSCTAKRNNKENTTPKNNKKTQRPKSEDTEATNNNSISDRDMDDYEQFLTGLFADNFVNAVLMKVQKSKKMAKELGFGNYTDESSDRCLETKLSNMPDSETLIKSLNLPKNDQKKYSQICYNRISKPMDDFLLSLISYEKEQESSVYRNIQDESSFIFTGDYPESSVQEEKVFTDDKYNGEKDSIGKDASEKQRLKDDENEDKDDAQVFNRNNAHSSQNLRHKTGQEEESVGIFDEHDDNMSKSSTKKRKNKKAVQLTNEIQPSSRDIKFKENDLINEPNVHEGPTFRNEFPKKSFDSKNAKHRRQSYKVENVPRPEIKTGYDIKNHPFKVNGELLDTDKYNLPNANYRIPNSAGYDSESVQNNRLVYDHPISCQEHRNLAKSDGFPSNANLQKNHYARLNQFYEYPQESWAEREEVNPSIHKDPQYFISDDVSSNDEEEYQLYPKLNEDNIPRRQMTDYQYHKNIYGKNSRMVKRNTDSNYDDDFLFFDLPDIEYDLY